MEKKISLSDGLIKQNMVFMSGLLIAPIVACATTVMKSLVICFVFSIVTFLSICVCRLIPRTIVYTVRVTLYCLAAAVFYIPAAYLAQQIFGIELVRSTGVYLPIVVTNSLILSKTETRFFLEPVSDMFADTAMFIIGFDAACMLTGLVRELFSVGRIAGAQVSIPFTVPALETTFGGFILLGIGGGVFRALYQYSRKRRTQPEPQTQDESLAEYAEDVGEFLVGKHKEEREKIRIYRAAVKRAKNENELLEMEFLSNKDILEEFEAIVAQGAGELTQSGDSENMPENAEELNTSKTGDSETEEEYADIS